MIIKDAIDKALNSDIATEFLRGCLGQETTPRQDSYPRIMYDGHARLVAIEAIANILGVPSDELFRQYNEQVRPVEV